MKASILIPCRNAAAWLRPCLESALAQTVEKEVLVWDDGSTDDSRDIIRSFGDRVRSFRGEPRGGNHARNQLLAASRGEWVQFLDADDYLEPEKISRQLAEGGDHAVLYSPVWEETWRDGQRAARTLMPLDSSADLFTQWFSWQLPQTGGALWRRAALIALGGWNEQQPCCQEHELYLRALQAGLPFCFCPTPGAVYRIWSESTVCRRDPVQVIRVKTALIDRMLTWLEQQGRLTHAQRAAASQACFEMARTWARYDLPAARNYYAGRRDRGLLRIAGPAAPLRYRALLALLGFGRAERLLATRRAGH